MVFSNVDSSITIFWHKNSEKLFAHRNIENDKQAQLQRSTKSILFKSKFKRKSDFLQSSTILMCAAYSFYLSE